MSIELMTRVWKESKQEGTALLLLLAIADHANQDNEAWPGIKSLARKTRLSERQVQYLVREIESTGELVVDYQASRKSTNLYTIYIPGRGGVQPTAPGGAAGFTGGVQPTAPESSYNHQVNTNSAAKSAAAISTVESDPWKGTPPQVVSVPQGGNKARRAEYTERCDQCQGVLTQDSDTCLSCGRPLKWEGSSLADKRAKGAIKRRQDEASKQRREQVERFSEVTKQVLAIARATAPAATLCDYAADEEDALYQYEQAYGSELVKSKLNEFKLAGDRGRGLIKHLIAFLGQYNPDRAKPKGNNAISTSSDDFAAEAEEDLLRRKGDGG